MFEANCVAKFVFGGVNNPISSVTVFGVEQIAGIDRDVSVNKVTRHRVAFDGCQACTAVSWIIICVEVDIGLVFIISFFKSKGTSFVPPFDSSFCCLVESLVIDVDVNSGAAFWPTSADTNFAFALLGALLTCWLALLVGIGVVCIS